jgi:CHASE2 domain-containing sensor protein
MFNQYAKNGFSNMVINQNDFRVVRDCMTLGRYGDTLQGSFPIEITNIYDPSASKKFLERDNRIEVVNFRRNVDKYPCLNYPEILNEDIDLSFIKDKIVLMGYLGPDTESPTLEDMFFTSLNKNYVGKSHPDMYGAVIHANIISMILTEDYCEYAPFWLSESITLLVFFFNMVFFTYLRAKHEMWYESLSILISIVELIALFFMILYTFHLFNIIFQLEGVFFGIIFSKQAYEIWNDSIVEMLAKIKFLSPIVKILKS